MSDLHNKIVCGDCVEILAKEDRPFADLIFADPPFNIGYKYDKYQDNKKGEKYIEWTRKWIGACKKVLKKHGSFYIAIGDEYAADVKIIAERENALVLRNWIIWHYTFGQQTKNKFARSHTHIFYFVNDAQNFTFNDYAVHVPSDRQLIYNDKRANPIGKMPDDVWDDCSRVCGTFKERRRWHPCQMPERLLKRIIIASSRPGDTVLDPFSGSGTTIIAAASLNRNYVGIDISKQYVEKSKKRLEEALKNKQMHLFLNETELDEIQRLAQDMAMDIKEITSNKKTLTVFKNQLAVRMNNGKKYSNETIADALKGLGC